VATRGWSHARRGFAIERSGAVADEGGDAVGYTVVAFATPRGAARTAILPGVERLLRHAAAIATLAALALGPSAGVVRGATVANPDAYTMNENGTLTVAAPGVLANDEGDAGAGICVVGYDYENLEGTVTDWRTDGSFTFEPWAHWTGTTKFTYGMRVGDGQCIGAADAQAIVEVTVLPVNEPPTAVIQGGTCDDGVRVRQDSGRFADPAHCVENHNWGDSLDEVTQLVAEWVVTNDNPDLFSEQPNVEIFDTTYGKLYFTPARGAAGQAEVAVRSRDNGGTERGGDDLSAPVRFTITITATPAATVSPTVEPGVSIEPTAGTPTIAPTSAIPSDGSSVAPTPTGEPSAAPDPGTPAGDASNAPMLVALALVLGIIAVGAGLLAPRLMRRSRGGP
jgi:hypothetical protein